jgi:hypothetical protein
MGTIEKKTVKSWQGFHRALELTKGQPGWVYRGQSDASWKLHPKVGRPPYTGQDDEKEVYDFWLRECAANLDSRPRTTMELLALAQHHGLATRLLDWSYSPLVAAYFAAFTNNDTDSALFLYKTKQFITKSADPFQVTGSPQYRPGTIGQRIIAQQGLFTVHGTPTASMEQYFHPDDVLIKIVIKKEYGPELLYDLDRYGINTMTMFPDFDGVARYVDWAITNRVKWGK